MAKPTRLIGFMAGLVVCGTVAAGSAATPAEKCTSAKLKAAGKNATCQTRALAKTAAGGTGDLDACRVKFAAVFDKLDSKGGCATTGDAAAIESHIETATNRILTDLAGACVPTTCSDGGGLCGIVSDECGGFLDCGVCERTCDSNSDCSQSWTCVYNVCQPKLGNYRGCGVQDDCLSDCCCEVGSCSFVTGSLYVPAFGICSPPEQCSGSLECPAASGSGEGRWFCS